jgi:hypothetical protein
MRASGSNIRTVILYLKDNGIQVQSCPDNSIIYDETVFSGRRPPLICKFVFQDQKFLCDRSSFCIKQMNSPLFGRFNQLRNRKPKSDDARGESN